MSEGSSCGRPTRRNIKKVMVLSSSSDSDSEDTVAAACTQRKRLRVLSDEGSSDSSGSPVVPRRKRTLPKLRDSDADSDTSGWATDHSAAPDPPPKPASGFASDSSEGNSEKCSICLLRFKDQEVGTPQTCEHLFCLDCITEWSKNVNTCPVDRITFESIVVRACAGGRVLRTERVTVAERRPSIDILLVEDPTPCQICSSTEHEETMLLCDGCDLGFHMQCLSPPLAYVPIDQWLCPNCDVLLEDIHLSELDDLFDDMMNFPPLTRGPRLAPPAREPRIERRSSRNRGAADEPSTSSSPGGNQAGETPSTSRGSRSSRVASTSHRSYSRTTTRRRTTGTHRRKYKRRRTKTVIIEYEVKENGKFPVTKTVKRKLKKRKTRKRQPRTAARRSLVRASVRAKLATLAVDGRQQLAHASAGVQELSARRQRAGIPSLSLFGNPHQLDYFSEEEQDISEGATAAVAARPTSSILDAYRQARRKLVSIPSPPHAAAAPDLLSDILESQTLLHSKKSIVSVSVDGQVNIKLESRHQNIPKHVPVPGDKQTSRVDLTEGVDAARKVPSYPGQSRGGWGGGYRYPREQGSGEGQRAGHDAHAGGPRAGGGYAAQAPLRRDEPDAYGNSYGRRAHLYPHNDDPHFDRSRRLPDAGRGPSYPHQRPDQGRYSSGPSWQPYAGAGPGPRHDAPPPQGRHSFGGFENPLDMRVGPAPHAPCAINNNAGALYGGDEPLRFERAPPAPSYQPLPEPPVFKFDKLLDVDKSEDEKSDPDLVIDTEKYDPTEPTHDEDSGDGTERARAPPAAVAAPPAPAALPAAAAPPAATPPTPVPPDAAAPLDASALLVSATVLDSAVRQVLHEHRSLIGSPGAGASPRDCSDSDSDGDCPNFSIYSATSVHIASNSGSLAPAPPPALAPERDLDEDLVQQDDDLPPPDPAPAPTVKNKEEEYKEKVSKRCPITTNPRNPIKIKLNTPSLIKRQVTLYDEEDVEADADADADPPEPSDVKSPSGAPLADENGDSPEAASKPETDATSDHEPEAPDEDAVEVHKELSGDEKDSSDEEDKCTTPRRGDDGSSAAEQEAGGERTPPAGEGAAEQAPSEDDDLSDSELRIDSRTSKRDSLEGEELLEKMTESISETEDERSYTPCLDENKSKDASLEADRRIEGLDTEMISEDEGNDLFSDPEERERARAERSPRAAAPAPPAPPAAPPEDGEILDRRKEDRAAAVADNDDDDKKKKKKESKKDAKDKGKSKGKKAEVAFKKLSKSGKERNYRERDKEDKGKSKKERRDSAEAEKKQKRKEKRKDLERYDVRSVVCEKRSKVKDAFGRDVSPRRSASPSPAPPSERSPSPAPASPRRRPRSQSPRRRSPPPPRARRKLSPRRRRSTSRARKRRRSASRSPKPKPAKKKKRARSERPPSRRRSPRRKSPKRKRAKRATRSPSATPARAAAWSPPSVDSRLLSPRTPPPYASPEPARAPMPAAPPRDKRARRERRRRDAERARLGRGKELAGPCKEVFTSGDNILVSVSFKDQERDPAAGERRKRKEARRDRRRRRRLAAAAVASDLEAAKPVAIIDLARSPFRELTPSPKNVIVLSDSDHGEKDSERPAPPPAAAEPAAGPKTPPSPRAPAPLPAPPAAPADELRGGPATPPDSPDAYDPFEPTRSASASPSPAPGSPARPCMTLEAAQKTNMSADDVIDRRPISPIEKVMALLQSTRDAPPDPPPASPPAKPASPAPLAPPAPPPALAAPPAAAPAPPVRIVLPSPTRSQAPKLFLAKPSPIKSNPIKPMQATKISRLPLPLAPRRALPAPGSDAELDSPYSPGSSDFGDLFEPPAPLGSRRDVFDALLDKPAKGRRKKSSAAKVPVKLNRKKGNKTQVGVKIDEDNLKILDDLPSSAVEMQVKSKFLKKLNRQERVVEEVKLVLKPHYNKKHVTKDEYKDILRRAVPKICHNKNGEINPTKIQALVEAYVKKFRKKHKLGLA